MDDPFDRAHQMKLEEQRRNKSMEGEQSFKPNCFTPKVFNTSQKVLAEDVELKKVTDDKILERSQANKIQHIQA